MKKIFVLVALLLLLTSCGEVSTTKITTIDNCDLYEIDRNGFFTVYTTICHNENTANTCYMEGKIKKCVETFGSLSGSDKK